VRGDPLVTEALGVHFGGLRALDDVSIRVPPGTIVGLIGPNGAGKTTLFDCVSGLLEATSGRVHLFGRDVTRWAPHARARLGLGRTFQRLELFGSLTVLENVAAGVLARAARKDAIQTARNALDALGLSEHADIRAVDVPLGLGRLVELARTLATDPRLLLLDEPSSGLRRDESALLAEAVSLAHADTERSVVIVEHDMDFVLGLSSYVYVLDFGKLIAEGTPDEIRADANVRAAYLGEEMDDDGAA